MLALYILSNHYKRHKQKLDYIAKKQKECKRKRVKRFGRKICLPNHPACHKNCKKINCIHCADSGCNAKRKPVLKLKYFLMFFIDILRYIPLLDGMFLCFHLHSFLIKIKSDVTFFI